MRKSKLQEAFSLSNIVLSEQLQTDDFIQLAEGVDLAELTKGDKDPLFVTVEVIHEGVSRNNKYYDRSIIEELCKQILSKKPNAYQGHLDVSEMNNKNPDAKTIWIGAGLKEVDGKLALFAKGYLLPKDTKFKDYMRRAVAAGKRLPVSIFAMSNQVYDSVKKVYRIVGLSLQSIDWAREFAEGVPSLTGTALLTTEMSEFNLLNNLEMDYDKITLKDLKDNRPDIVSEIESNVKSTQVVAEMASSLNVSEEVLVETVQNQGKELSNLKGIVAETRKSQARTVVEKVLLENISDDAVRLVVETEVNKNLDNVLTEMAQESNLDENKIKEVVTEQLKTDEVKALLRRKTDTSVPASVKNTPQSKGSITKIVNRR